MHIFNKAPTKSTCPDVYTFIPWSYSENGHNSGRCKPNSHSHDQTLCFFLPMVSFAVCCAVSCPHKGTRTSVKAPQATQQQFRCCKVLKTVVVTDDNRMWTFFKLFSADHSLSWCICDIQATRLRATIAEHCGTALALADDLARVVPSAETQYQMALFTTKAFALLKSVSFRALAPSVKRQLSGLMSSESQNIPN